MPDSLLPLIATQNASQVADFLLQEQLFPNVKDKGEELPPFFTSSTFTQKIASQLIEGTFEKPAPFGYVRFRSRRFDGLVRRLGLPHPVAHARLVLLMRDNWSAIELKLKSTQSAIKPEIRPGKRLIEMTYDTSQSSTWGEIRRAQGREYEVRADISNCFPSLYSHSIDWALRTKIEAKKDRSIPPKTWQGKLDQAVRNCHNGETTGVMIGPATSNILSEIVLQQIDVTLGHNYCFRRYIDDYTMYCDSHAEAEMFISDLDSALTEYNLSLNTNKTKITPLRHRIGDPWIDDIHVFLRDPANAYHSVKFLQRCELLSQNYPDKSVLTYSLKTLLSKRDCPHVADAKAKGLQSNNFYKDNTLLLDEIIRLTYFQPHLTHLMTRQLAHAVLGLDQSKDRVCSELSKQLERAADRKETDTILWLIYAIEKVLDLRINDEILAKVIATDDDLVWTALATTSDKALKSVIKVVSALDPGDTLACQEHWLSRYELYRIGELDPSKCHATLELPWFEIAATGGLAFTNLTG